MTGFLFETHTREQLNQHAPDSLVVVPIGACEQHGPHLPVGTDFMVAGEVARRAALALGDEVGVLVAPTLPFGHSPHHLPFGGTVSITQETFRTVLVEIGESLAASGFRRVFFLNGHGGNVELSMLAARHLGLTSGIAAAAGSYWLMAWDRLLALGAHDRARLPGHAGAFETSVVLALWPHLVAETRPRRDVAGPGATDFFGPYTAVYPGEWERTDGFSDSPAEGDAASGAAYVEAIVDAVAAHLRSYWEQTEKLFDI